MSTHEFERAVKVEQLSKASKVWFPHWIGRFAAYVKCAGDAPIRVEQEQVIHFLRMLRDKKVPAWQRLERIKGTQPILCGTRERKTGLVPCPNCFTASLRQRIKNHSIQVNRVV